MRGIRRLVNFSVLEDETYAQWCQELMHDLQYASLMAFIAVFDQDLTCSMTQGVSQVN